MPRTRRSRPAVVAIALLAFASLAAGCSSSGSDSSDDPSTTVAEKTTTTGGTSEDPSTTEPDSTTTTETPTTEAGGGGDTGDRQAYVDAIVENLSGDESFNPFEPGQVECLANGYIDTIGLDELTGAGVTPEEFGEGSGFGDKLDLDDTTANALYDTYSDCDIDLKDLFKEVAADFTGAPLTSEEEACLDQALTDDALRTSFVADLRGEELDVDPLDALETCVDSGGSTPDAPAANTLAPPVTLGPAPSSGN